MRCPEPGRGNGAPAEDGGSADPADVTAVEIQAFRDQLPDLRDIASGKKPRADVEKDLNEFKDALTDEGFVLRSSFSLWTLLWLFLGVGSAYKIAAGTDG